MTVADSLNLSVSNRQLNRLPATSCRFVEPILSVLHECWICLFRIGNWIGNRQLVAGCRLVKLVCFESATDSLNLYCLFRIWIGNRQLVCFESATESANQLPIRWTYIVCFESEVAGCSFVELILCVSNRQQNRQPAFESATGYLGPYIVSFESVIESATGNWIGNRQPTANYVFESANGNRQPVLLSCTCRG